MSRYRFSYHTIVRYSTPISYHHFQLRCTPRGDGSQRIVELNCELLGSAQINHTCDIFGNNIIYGSMVAPHDLFVVAVNGVVEHTLSLASDIEHLSLFRTATHLTQEDGAMQEFAARISSAGSGLDQALALAEAIFGRMSYTPSITNNETSAQESFHLGGGVCQDYAHQLIAMLRARAIPSRYVAGLVVGTGESHAWVETYSHGQWHGVDPTHNCLVQGGYIKLSHGRDAADCSITRGVHRGVAEQLTEVNVVVEQIFK